MSYAPPPPPPPPGTVEEKAPPVAWLVPVAAVLAVIGVFTPWFKPQAEGTVNGQSKSSDAVKDALYSYKEGRLGLIAPIVLVIVGIGVVKLLTGSNSRFSRGSRSPVHSAALGALGAGAVAAVALAVSYFLLPSTYKFVLDDGRKLSWDDTEKLGRSSGIKDFSLSQGPQVGFWLTAAAALLSLVAGVLMLVMRSKATAAGPQLGFGPAPQGGFPPPSGPPQGTPDAQQGWQQQPAQPQTAAPQASAPQQDWQQQPPAQH